MSIVLRGGQSIVGTATNNTETDSYLVQGAANTIYTLGGGNLSVTGETSDTGTKVFLAGLTNPAPNQFRDTINIALDGSGNVIESIAKPSSSPGGRLNDATVTVTVSGTGGGNVVNLNNNGAGSTSLNLGGAHNSVTLNGDATNSVTLGGGSATVSIGQAGDNNVNLTASVALSGGGNSVTGGDERFTVTGGDGGGNTVKLGSGNDMVDLGGNTNTIAVGDGFLNFITANGNGNHITVGSGANVISAIGNNEAVVIRSGDKPFSGPGADSVFLGGTGDSVTEVSAGISAPANVSIFGSTGSATIRLGNGNDTITADGNNNKITLGNGVDTVTANGDANTITVGSGSDTITDTGSGSTITLNGNAASHDFTSVGTGDLVNANRGVQGVLAQGSDTINLNATGMGSAIAFGGTGNMAFLRNDASASTHFAPSGSGNDLRIIADAAGTYTGAAGINGLVTGNGTLTFSGFTGADAGLNTAAGVLADFLAHPVAGGYQITTAGGGTITLHTSQPLSLSMF